MHHDDLKHELQSLPVKYLHHMARGRIHRHFRLGKQRLVEIMLGFPPDQILALESELQQILTTRQERLAAQEARAAARPQISASPFQPQKPQGKRKPNLGPSHSQPSITLQQILEGIGVPEPRPFVPDPWQTEAVEHLAHSDVIVSAPTGSGKTYVAIQAIRQAMAFNQTVIYTSPLKALSNTKFMEFSQLFGPDQVGILTGDRRDNAQAPLLVMTTEILRNLFYDAASGEIDLRLHTLGLVILDESQYLADPERGVVWEETIILCPSQARLLLLSASIGNPQDLAEWLQAIRPIPCHLIRHAKRSVPLRGLYLHPTGQLVPLFKNQDILQGKGYIFHPETKHLFSEYEIKPFR
ncbi:MAG TPA: DEAD/DEAH box helicase [Nitrospirales bacterium]|nr:DEAD/DEAH box helicase [Nitrospirales bacterium]